MLDAENPAEAAEPTTPTQGTETAATESPATESPRGGETAAPEGTAEAAAPAKKTAAKRTAKKATAKKTAAKKTTAKRTAKKATAAPAEPGETLFAEAAGDQAAPGRPTPGAAQAPETAEAGADDAAVAPAKRTRKSATKKTTAKRTTKKAAAEAAPAEAEAPAEALVAAETTAEPGAAETEEEAAAKAAPAPATALLFQPPDPTKAVVTTRRRKPAKAKAAEEEAPEVEEQPQEKPAKKAAKKKPAKKVAEAEVEPAEEKATEAAEEAAAEGEEEQGGERRRRRRGGRRRRRSGGDEAEAAETGERGEAAEDKETPEEEGEEGAGTSRRRRRRRRGEGEGEEPRARKPRNAENEITALSGSTRLEAKKQRRREGREAGRRRAPIVSEAEFLARRESVDRVMVIRQRDDLTQIAVLEDKVLVEHYVSRESQNSLIGNVYLGRVQNVLPSMEAAFIDIGKGRNAVLYAGEVNWDALGHKNGTPRKIESVLKSGQSILVQVTKDPIGHKGARLTSQISLPGRFLVYVPDGTTSGISRKLPDTERNRLKTLLKEIVPESAGVIVRTAAEGASEDELTLDVERLTARWEDIDKKVKAGNAPQLLYGEPDLTLKVVRDLFTEDFNKLVIAGDDAWDTVEGYVSHVAPDLNDRLEKYDGGRDVFAEYRIDEQIEKALDRKVWLPSGGSLVIDRTEAMTVVDVNTGKFTGSGGNLEETVTKNNLEAAEEIVRQLRLRDIGGIIVVDFIDMVLESNRDLVLRRLVECLGRDRTRHQVAEVTSLGLVQMTRKRIGTGLLEAFSEACEHCQGRGLILHHEPVEPKKKGEDDSRRGRRGGGRGRGRDQGDQGGGGGVPSPKDFAAMARHEEKVEAEKAAAEQAEAPSEKQPSEKTPEKASGRKPEQPVEKPAAEQVPEAEAEAAPEAERTESAAEAAAPPAEPKVTVRSRSRGRGRGRKATAEVQPQDEQPAADHQGAVGADEIGTHEQPEAESPAGTPVEASGEPAAEAAEPAAEPTTEPTQEAPAPAAPTVVTTVRRRSARRAAGPPSEAAATAAAATETAVGATAQGSVDGSPRGGVDVAEAEQVTDEPADADPVAALVDSAELDGADTDADEVAATPHVPVKKRGSRRR